MSKRDEKPRQGFITEKEFGEVAPRPMAGRGAEALVERLIQDGMAEGKFSNLANEGQPLKLEEDNPYVEDDMKLAFKVLENAGFAPPWIEMDKEVEAALGRATREREEHRRWLKRRLNDIALGPTHHFMRDLRQLAATHQRWLKTHSQRLRELNQKIHNFNHICPVTEKLKIPLSVDKIIEEFDKSCPAIPQV